MKLGYKLDQEKIYERFSYGLCSFVIYRISDTFPRITHSSFKNPLDYRIQKLYYSIELKDLESNLLKDPHSHLQQLST